MLLEAVTLDAKDFSDLVNYTLLITSMCPHSSIIADVSSSSSTDSSFQFIWAPHNWAKVFTHCFGFVFGNLPAN